MATMFTEIIAQESPASARRGKFGDELRRGLAVARSQATVVREGGYTVGPSIAAARIGVVTMPDVTDIVFVVDDDISVRESLELLIKAAGWRPETFVSARDFLSRPRATVPCCLVLDVTLPGLNGLELQQQLARRTEMPIIFITGYGDVPTTVRAMKAGAVEFLTKPFKDDVLLDAIHQALERSRVALREESQMQLLRTCYASLTPREREVMALVVSGLLNKQVGGELGISEITVKAHRGQLMRKMKADSLAELVTMAARLGLHAARRA
jgi:FixJ family two-component response regulator